MPLFLYLCHFDSQGLAAQDVEVQVENGLTGIRAAVGNYPVTTGEIFGSGDLGNDRKNVGDHSAVFLCDAIHGRNVSLGNHQNVGGCLGRNIPESQDLIVLIYLCAGNVAVCDLTE